MANIHEDTLPTAGSGLGDRLTDEAAKLRDRAAEAGQQGLRALDTGRQRAASGLEDAADKLHDAADKLPGGERVSHAAHSTADALGATGRYVRKHSVGEMFDSLGEFVKAHPTQALVGAVVVGFLVGRGMRRN